MARAENMFGAGGMDGAFSPQDENQADSGPTIKRESRENLKMLLLEALRYPDPKEAGRLMERSDKLGFENPRQDTETVDAFKTGLLKVINSLYFPTIGLMLQLQVLTPEQCMTDEEIKSAVGNLRTEIQDTIDRDVNTSNIIFAKNMMTELEQWRLI